MQNDEKKLDNRYIVREEIGSGGFGAVYLAEDTRFGGDNKVAIKKIVHTNKQITKSFRQEADLLYNLSHPNLPKVTNCFQEDGASFIVMDYITGEDLAVKLKKGKKFSVEEVLRIADTVLDALEYLHSFLIFHRDIKPHNIKIDESGKIFLLDFGTAKGTFDETTLTRTTDQSITGYTPFYAPLEQMLRVDANSYLLLQSTESPHLEQFLDKKTDARSDIYSLGATLFHLLTGYSPERATATVRAHAVWSGKEEPLPDCQSLNPEIPNFIAQIIKRCMEILPKDRFQTATQLRQTLIKPHQTPTHGTENDKTIPITADKIPIQKPNNVEIPISQTAPSAPPVPFKTRASKRPEFSKEIVGPESVAGSIDDLFDKDTIGENQTTSKKLLVVFGSIAGILLFVLIGLGGWFIVKPMFEKPETQPVKVTGGAAGEENTNSTEGNKPVSNTDKPIFTESETTRTMDYSLLVQKMRDGQKFQDPFESSGQEVFESGYQFQMRFTPSESGYLYVFNEGLNEKGEKIFNIIFPTPLRNDGKAKVSSNEKYESGWNEFGGTAGTENFWVIWSKEKSDLLENSLADAFESDTGELTDGDLKDELKNFLEENSKTEKEISKNFKEQYSQIKFKGDSAVHLIKLEHR